jgi:hypothetical protein
VCVCVCVLLGFELRALHYASALPLEPYFHTILL